MAKSAARRRTGGDAQVSMEAGTDAVKHFVHNLPKNLCKHAKYRQICSQKWIFDA
jgi:hypothetical protein